MGCCTDPDWPGASPSLLEKIEKAGGNYTHIRMGPWAEGAPEGSRFVRSEILDTQEEVIREALERRIYVEVDAIDGWVLERPSQSYWHDGCDVISRAPEPRHIEWINALVDRFAPYPNVFYEVSNESFDCRGRVSPEWEFGIRDAIIAAYHRNGRQAPPVGTNSHHLDIERGMDYAARHNRFAQKAEAYPVLVNEYPYETAAHICQQLEAARVNHTLYAVWLGDLDAAGQARVFSCLKSTILGTP